MTTVFITLMQNVQAYLKMIISTFKEQPLRNTRCSFTTETCCEHTKHTGIPFTSVKAGNGPNVLENSAYSLSTFLFFDKNILGNEAATELRIKAKLSNLRKGIKPKSAHGIVLHLTIRPYNATMQFPSLLPHFHEKLQRCPRRFTTYIFETGSCLSGWF